MVLERRGEIVKEIREDEVIFSLMPESIVPLQIFLIIMYCFESLM